MNAVAGADHSELAGLLWDLQNKRILGTEDGLVIHSCREQWAGRRQRDCRRCSR